MKKLITFAATLILPITAFAQGTGGSLGNVENLATSIGRIINILIPIAFALAILAFFWGIAIYIFGGEHDKEKAKKTMLWGIIAIFVMAAVWGLVKFIGQTFGVETNVGAPSSSSLVPH